MGFANDFCCIYSIVSKKTRRRYIGSAKFFKKRRGIHLWHLKRGTHHSSFLQNHANKYGIKDLSFEVLEMSDIDCLIEKEQYYIDLFQPEFNISRVAYSTIGVPCSEDKKALLSKIHKGRKATPEAIEANRQGQLKRNPFPMEMRKNISKGLLGRKISKESCLKNAMSQKTKKEVLCITTGVVYFSIKDAAKQLGINYNCVSRACRGITKTAGKKEFEFI